MNSRPLLILTVIVLAICGGAVWFLNSQPEPLPQATPPPATPLAQKPEETTQSDLPPVPEPVQPVEMVVGEIAKPAEPAKPLADWEVKIDQVLRNNADETQTAQMLINMLPSLPAEGQAEAAQHISNLILDKDYNRVLPLVKNPGLPEEVLDVLVTDLMNREDEVKLPALLEIAKIPNHPHHEEAATDLQIFLDEDYGQDWGKWTAAMKTYLKRQADENAAAEKEAADTPPLPNNVPKPQ
jgi:hypothetical protein